MTSHVKDLVIIALIEVGVQGSVSMEAFWGGDILAVVAPIAEEEVMGSKEGMVTVYQMVDGWEMAKMEITGLDSLPKS